MICLRSLPGAIEWPDSGVSLTPYCLTNAGTRTNSTVSAGSAMSLSFTIRLPSAAIAAAPSNAKVALPAVMAIKDGFTPRRVMANVLPVSEVASGNGTSLGRASDGPAPKVASMSVAINRRIWIPRCVSFAKHSSWQSRLWFYAERVRHAALTDSWLSGRGVRSKLLR